MHRSNGKLRQRLCILPHSMFDLSSGCSVLLSTTDLNHEEDLCGVQLTTQHTSVSGVRGREGEVVNERRSSVVSVRHVQGIDVLLGEPRAGAQRGSVQEQLAVQRGPLKHEGPSAEGGVGDRRGQRVGINGHRGALRNREASVQGQRRRDSVHRGHLDVQASVLAAPPITDNKPARWSKTLLDRLDSRHSI